MATEYKKGLFTPTNPKKYKGDPSNIVFRSSWEARFMRYCDRNAAIVEWSSEEISIPYLSPLDNRVHRYFPDFIIKYKTPTSEIKTAMIEIKPKIQTKQPKTPKRQTKRYLQEVATWGVNQSKWQSAEDYCRCKGWEFKILTEAELFKGKY